MRLPPDEARRRFAAAPVARLATLRPDGAPHIVPVVFALDGDEILTAVDAKPKERLDLARLANVAANPAVSLLADAYEADWSRLWWARADGRARVVPAGPERERAIALLAAKYVQYASPGASFGAALIVRVERWSGWSATAEQVEAGRP